MGKSGRECFDSGKAWRLWSWQVDAAPLGRGLNARINMDEVCQLTETKTPKPWEAIIISNSFLGIFLSNYFICAIEKGKMSHGFKQMFIYLFAVNI